MDNTNGPDEGFLHHKNQIRRAFIDAVHTLGTEGWRIDDDKAMDAAVLWLIEVRKRRGPPAQAPEWRNPNVPTELAKLSEKISSDLAQPVFTPGPK